MPNPKQKIRITITPEAAKLLGVEDIVTKQTEEPTQDTLDQLKESEADYKAGRVTSFKTGEEALEYLDKKLNGNVEALSVKSIDTTVKSSVKSEAWEERFNLLWGIAPEGTLKYDKGESVKDFIRTLLKNKESSTLQEVRERIERLPGIAVATDAKEEMLISRDDVLEILK